MGVVLDMSMLTRPYDGPAEVSSAIANELLTVFNIGNRRKRPNLAKYILDQIRSGEWQDDHPQPICFSSRPRLIDGQHRLMAIADSGVTVTAHVRCGVRDELREYIDTGISRKLEDRCEFDADYEVNRCISTLIANWIAIASGRTSRPTPVDAWNFFEQHRPAIMFGVTYLTMRQKAISRTPVISAMAEFHERNPVLAGEFGGSLFIPDGDVQPARMLRDWLQSKAPKGGGTGIIREVYLRCTGCMQAHLDGRNVKIVRAAAWK